MNTVQKFEARQLEKLTEGKKIPNFSAGDTLKVNVKVIEGTRERIQAYEGVCIARHGSGMNATFTVRKISLGEGVERVFPLYSPRLESIELIRRGSVRRAKLYYLRDLRGKKARISERTSGHDIEDKPEKAPKEAKKSKKAKKKEAKAAPEAEKSAQKPEKADKKPASKKAAAKKADKSGDKAE